MRADSPSRSRPSRWPWLCAAFICACAQAAAPSASDLIARMQSEPMFWKRLDIADELAQVATVQDLAPLEPLLADRDRHARGNIAYLFAKLGDQRGLATLIGILNDHSDDRLVALHPNCTGGLTGTPTEEQTAAALKRCPALLQIQIREDRYYAVHLLGKLRDPRALDVLIPMLDHDEVNYNVAWALGEIGGPRVIPALIEALSNKDALVRVTAIGSLEKLRATQALPNLTALFDDAAMPSAGERVPVGTVARKAAESLQRAVAACTGLKDMSELVSAKAAPQAPAAFEAIRSDMTLRQILEHLGPAARDVGSGLYVLEWKSTDGRTFRANGPSLCAPPFRAAFVGGAKPNR